jgi:hypothetical protein
MSNTTLRSAARAMRIAFNWAAALFGREKWVPLTSTALALSI